MRTRLLLGTRLNKLFVLILKATERLIFDKTKKTLSYQKNVYSSQGFGKTILWYQERVGRGDLRIVATSKIDGKGSEWCCLFRKNQETKTLKPKQFSLAVGEVRSRSIIKRKWLCSGRRMSLKGRGLHLLGSVTSSGLCVLRTRLVATSGSQQKKHINPVYSAAILNYMFPLTSADNQEWAIFTKAFSVMFSSRKKHARDCRGSRSNQHGSLKAFKTRPSRGHFPSPAARFPPKPISNISTSHHPLPEPSCSLDGTRWAVRAPFLRATRDPPCHVTFHPFSCCVCQTIPSDFFSLPIPVCGSHSESLCFTKFGAA